LCDIEDSGGELSVNDGQRCPVSIQDERIRYSDLAQCEVNFCAVDGRCKGDGISAGTAIGKDNGFAEGQICW
jgi:hypothetical protein